MSDRARWLLRAPLGEGGAVLSWVNPARPGYAYPEAAGLWLRFAARAGADVADVARVRERLRADVVDGRVGRGGVAYVFDTAVALGGLIQTGAVSAVERAMFEAVLDDIAARRPCVGAPGGDRWSTRWTGHMLKVIPVLRRYGERTGDARAEAAAHALLAGLHPRVGVEPFDGGDFYTHAFCYALEGLLAAGAWGLADVAVVLRDGADTLARMQRGDGALSAFRSGGPARADATAQAARLWLAVDRARYAGAIGRAFAALDALDAGDGGLRYEEGSGDVNTWATVFAVQADAWCVPGALDVGDLW